MLRLTNTQFKQIIKEEIRKAIKEFTYDSDEPIESSIKMPEYLESTEKPNPLRKIPDEKLAKIYKEAQEINQGWMEKHNDDDFYEAFYQAIEYFNYMKESEEFYDLEPQEKDEIIEYAKSVAGY